MRNMSFAMTTPQVRARTKTVTRRLGWRNLVPGEKFWGVEKSQGLKKGEHVVRLCMLQCVSNKLEPLNALLTDPDYGALEAAREGFPHFTGRDFVNFFRDGRESITLDQPVSRIEFCYV